MLKHFKNKKDIENYIIPREFLNLPTKQIFNIESVTIDEDFKIGITKEGYLTILYDENHEYFLKKVPNLLNDEINLSIETIPHTKPYFCFLDGIFIIGAIADRININQIEGIYGNNSYRISYTPKKVWNTEFMDFGISLYSDKKLTWFIYIYLMLSPNPNNQGGLTLPILTIEEELDLNSIGIDFKIDNYQEIINKSINWIESNLKEMSIFELIKDEIKFKDINRIIEEYKVAERNYRNEKPMLDFFNRLSEPINQNSLKTLDSTS